MSELSPVAPDPGSTARFVVHEHYATTHHFDLRLEGGGVLWSWALPKGLPSTPSEHRLAIRVDDHDLDHIEYVDDVPVDPDDPEGPIRKSIWDTGTYTVVRAAPDKIVFDLDGERGSARYALIRTGADNWLMRLMT